MIREADLQYEIRKALGALVDDDGRGLIHIERNNTGQAEHDGGARTRYGLAPGSADLIGTLWPSGRYVAIEVKRPGVRLPARQYQWLLLKRRFNACAVCVRSVAEALAVVRCANAAPCRHAECPWRS